MAEENPPEPRLKTKIEIPLHSIRKYVGGSGPPLAKISLAPSRDSTAYIIDQFVLPTLSNTTKESRRLIHYHIGFTDLPAAKILVPCDKVLDYVSPRELEDWEYKQFDLRMEKMAEEKAQGATRRKALQAKVPASHVVKKKPGRPPKVKDAQDGPSVSGSPKDDALALAKEVAGPSLSTPQKRNLGSILDEGDNGDTTSNVDSDDAAVQMQLHREAENEHDVCVDMGSGHSVDQLPLPFEPSGEDTSSRASSIAPPHRKVPLQPPVPASALPKQRRPPAKTTPIPSPQLWKKPNFHPAWAQSVGLQPETAIQALPSTTNGHVVSNGLEKLKSSTPIHPKFQQDMDRLKASSSVSVSMSGSQDGSVETTPRFSTPATATTKPGVVSSWGSINKRKTPPVEAPSDDPFAEPPIKVQKTATKPKTEKPEKTEKKKRPKKPAADEWEVKELLNDAWVSENGTNVHKYLVLWVGDWPEDQNPTWEPEENIGDRQLIKRYEEKKRNKKVGMPTSKKMQKTLDPYLTMKSPYSSVAEAFEGDLGVDGVPPPSHVDSDAEEMQKEHFLVTEEPPTKLVTPHLKKPATATAAAAAKPAMASSTTARASSQDSFQRFDDIMAKYKQKFSGGQK